MTAYVPYLSILVQLLLVLVVFLIWQELKLTRQWLQATQTPIVCPPRSVNTTSEGAWVCSPMAVWVYRDVSWQLDPASLPPGYKPGPPPHFAGSYQGQRVRTECLK